MDVRRRVALEVTFTGTRTGAMPTTSRKAGIRHGELSSIVRHHLHEGCLVLELVWTVQARMMSISVVGRKLVIDGVPPASILTYSFLKLEILAETTGVDVRLDVMVDHQKEPVVIIDCNPTRINIKVIDYHSHEYSSYIYRGTIIVWGGQWVMWSVGENRNQINESKADRFDHGTPLWIFENTSNELPLTLQFGD
jgi:hypothetical protein